MANHSCTYCQNPIITCRIRCDDCPDFDLCLQCFACGVEAGSHKKEHDYQVFDDGTFSVFENDDSWSITEEECLLDAVEQFGFGNWDDVANHVKTRDAEACKDHYFTFYLHGNVGKATYRSEPPKKVIDHTCPNGGPLSPSLTSTHEPMDLTPLETTELGYMPLREDFEREYDNEAESLVSELALNYDDEDTDIAFKLAQVDIYRQRLKERQRRKHISKEFGVIQSSTSIGIKKYQANKKKLSKDEREFRDKMRVFAQFHAAKEQEEFFDSLHKEKKLKSRIKELMKYRRNGITKMDDCSGYEAERVKRDKKKDTKKKPINSSSSSQKRISMESLREKEGEDELIIGKGENGKKNGVVEFAPLPGCDLLSEREHKLCSAIGMQPATYITVKTCIIKDYLQRRHGFPVKIRYPSHLDKTHRRRILNFLSENGWIGGVGAY